MKRVDWARCREPYRTELNTIGSHWIEGALGDEALAIELLNLLVELDWVAQPDQASKKISLADVSKDALTLANAMVTNRSTAGETPEDRRGVLDILLAQQRDIDGPAI